MNKISPILLGLSLAVAGSSMAAAQQTATIPNVLQITREFVKPYKGGAAHDKTESAFIAAMTKAKFPAYYVGLNSLSGKSRALFLTRYDSFAEWEKDNKTRRQEPGTRRGVGARKPRRWRTAGEVDSGVFTTRRDLSYHPHADISHARYMEITDFMFAWAITAEWHKLTKMYRDAHDKAGTHCALGHVRGCLWMPPTAPTLPSAATSPWPISTLVQC